MKRDFSNHEIVTFAVYLLGGDSSPVDSEDVAKKANDIAPGRFTWRKYPDQINIHHVRAFLFDARKANNGGLLIGTEREGWLLTESGLGFAKANIARLATVDLSRVALSPKDRQWLRTERTRMLASEAFAKFQRDGPENVTTGEAEALFRLNDYVLGKARERKVVRILNTFGDDPDLGNVVKELAKMIRGR